MNSERTTYPRKMKCVTSCEMFRLVFRHFAAASTRVSPDFAQFKHNFTFFRVLTQMLPLARTTRKITVSDKCSCACVYVSVHSGTTEKTRRNTRQNACGMGVGGVLCGITIPNARKRHFLPEVPFQRS